MCLLLVLLLFQSNSLNSKVEENNARIQQLESDYVAEQERTKEIEELKQYIQSEEFMEKYAKDKIGLVKDNEIIFKAK